MKKVVRRPQPNEFGVFYTNYIKKVKADNYMDALARGQRKVIRLLESIPEAKWNYQYAPNKWTVKEVVQHIIDGERVFAYRALSIARGDQTPLPGFDENVFADNSHANLRSPSSLIKEYKSVRESTLRLFKSFSEEDVARIGKASDHPASPLAIGFIIAGHERHHLDILKERYLQ